MTHYEQLGVTPLAGRDQIRLAYRDLARRYHPDSQAGSSERMAAINEAWRVLGDPARRAVYDAHLRSSGSASPQSERSAAAPSARPAPTQSFPTTVSHDPAKFPWRFMLVMAVLGIGFVLVNAALTDPPSPAVPDNLLQVGSCVTFDATNQAVETSCAAVHDGVVAALVSFDAPCSLDTEAHRDRQGMGVACVRLSQNG